MEVLGSIAIMRDDDGDIVMGSDGVGPFTTKEALMVIHQLQQVQNMLWKTVAQALEEEE